MPEQEIGPLLSGNAALSDACSLPLPMLASIRTSQGASHMAQGIDDLLRRAVEKKASDLHLKVGNHPYLRIDGVLEPASRCPPRDAGRDAVHGVQHDDQPAEAEIQGNGRTGHGLWRGRPGPIPRQRVPAARQRGHGPARDSHQDSHDRRAGSAPGDREDLRGAARLGARHRHHRLGQIHHARGDGRPHQYHARRPHDHHRGPHRIPAPR